jgi:hypothetical protein
MACPAREHFLFNHSRQFLGACFFGIHCRPKAALQHHDGVEKLIVSPWFHQHGTSVAYRAGDRSRAAMVDHAGGTREQPVLGQEALKQDVRAILASEPCPSGLHQNGPAQCSRGCHVHIDDAIRVRERLAAERQNDGMASGSRKCKLEPRIAAGVK